MRETYRDLINVYCAFTSRLSPRHKETFYKYVIEKKGLSQISKEYGVAKNKSALHLKAVRIKFAEFVKNVKQYLPHIDKLTRDDMITDLPGDGTLKNKFTGMVYDAYIKRGCGGYWGKHNKRQAYKTLVRCQIQKYLDKYTEQVDEDEEKIICCLCDKCNNGEMNGRRKKYTLLKIRKPTPKRITVKYKPVVVERHTLWGRKLSRVIVKGKALPSETGTDSNSSSR